MIYTANERESFPGECSRVAAGKLYMKLRETYGEKLDVDFYDPRCFIFLFDTLRYRLRGNEITWVLDGKVIFRGNPSWDDLKKCIDERLSA
ncbi:MAG: hypothetical protein SOZ52_04350 [Pyramidobacter sp.]|nr:hypothetical protein [Pyramidobacter sp.]